LNKLNDIIFLYTHGAGAGIKSEFMSNMVHDLNSFGLNTIPFNFPYMKIMEETGKRRPPDRMPKLIDSFKQQIRYYQSEYPDKKIVIGGKSMGGRVASLVTAELEKESNYNVSACICLGFPFHPPKKLDKYRGEHLAGLTTPTLILQGERDTFGTQAEIENYQLSNTVQVNYIPDGDHSFKPRARSGYTLEDNLHVSVKSIVDFVVSLSA